ncbi:MAG: hypothetical protein COA53_13015 [Rhodobacteraceae bacterium]|nr:MAG: hypothetical protein COA53_13015 [Paracoccaceae bacterium]
MTIDFHAHWVPEELANALRKRSTPPHIAMSDTGEQFHMPVGGLPYDDIYSDLGARLRFMDTHDIQTQVLSLPCLFGLDSRPTAEALPLLTLFNDATAVAVKNAPDRFAGLASLPFDDMNMAAQEYRRARRELGLLGAIIPINYFLSIAGVDALRPLLDMAEKEGGHLFLHPGRRPDEAEAMDAAGTDRYPDSVMARRQLEIQHQVAAAMVTLLWGDFTNKYKGFTLHVANMGGTLPLVVERMDYTSRMRTHEPILPSARVRNSPVLVDCSSMGPIAITAAVACFGAKNILFGTDNPIYRSEWQLDAVRDAKISDEDRRDILHDNGARALARWQ